MSTSSAVKTIQPLPDQGRTGAPLSGTIEAREALSALARTRAAAAAAQESRDRVLTGFDYLSMLSGLVSLGVVLTSTFSQIQAAWAILPGMLVVLANMGTALVRGEGERDHHKAVEFAGGARIFLAWMHEGNVEFTPAIAGVLTRVVQHARKVEGRYRKDEPKAAVAPMGDARGTGASREPKLVSSSKGLVAYSRRGDRIVPHYQDVDVRVPGRQVRAKIIDVSRSGVALSMGLRVKVGTSVFIGSTPAKAVREIPAMNGKPSGIGFEFVRMIPDASFNENVRL